jgi:hypothetical protein
MVIYKFYVDLPTEIYELYGFVNFIRDTKICETDFLQLLPREKILRGDIIDTAIVFDDDCDA